MTYLTAQFFTVELTALQEAGEFYKITNANLYDFHLVSFLYNLYFIFYYFFCQACQSMNIIILYYIFIIIGDISKK